MKVCVIGCGASGMVCAITLAKNGHNVTVFESREKPGKKLLITGNGRCNMTNHDMDLRHFHGDRAFVSEVLSQAGYCEVVDFFNAIGIETKARNGYVYPRTDQAVSVLNALTFEMQHLGVKVVTNCKISKIWKEGERFVVWAGKDKPVFDKCIIAAGSKAAPKTGSDGSGYELAEEFGHSIEHPLPALTKLYSNNRVCNTLAGVRCDGTVRLFICDEPVAFESGEIQFVKEGISGIPTFQISFLASKALYEGKKVCVLIDFYPEKNEEELTDFFNKRKRLFPNRSVEQFLNGIFNGKVSFAICEKSGINLAMNLEQMSARNMEKLVKTIKAFRFDIFDTGDFENAQVCLGGVMSYELKPSLESKLEEGLYFCGEIIDVNGDCGGYNLQWAFSSGLVAGGLK